MVMKMIMKSLNHLTVLFYKYTKEYYIVATKEVTIAIISTLAYLIMIRSPIAVEAVIRDVSSPVVMTDLYSWPEHVNLGSRTFVVAAASLGVATAATATVLVYISLRELE